MFSLLFRPSFFFSFFFDLKFKKKKDFFIFSSFFSPVILCVFLFACLFVVVFGFFFVLGLLFLVHLILVYYAGFFVLFFLVSFQSCDRCKRIISSYCVGNRQLCVMTRACFI